MNGAVLRRWLLLSLTVIATVMFIYTFYQRRQQLVIPVDQQHTGIIDQVLQFVPNDFYGDCKQLFPSGDDFPLTPAQMQIRREFESELRRVEPKMELEGHSGQLPQQIRCYFEIAKHDFINTICEVGFNAGHSTLVWLLANPIAKVYSFDAGVHNYSKPMAQWMMDKFPGRLTMTWGVSQQTLPEFIKKPDSPKCNLLIVDGSHLYEVAVQDFENMRQMALPNNILIFDDIPTNWFKQTLGKIWEGAKVKGTIKEHFACGFDKGEYRGFSVGSYL